MSDAQKRAAAARRHREKAAAQLEEERKAARIEYSRKRFERLAALEATARAGQAEILKQAKATGLMPVRLGNLLGPEGNVFNVIGAVRTAIGWSVDHGVEFDKAKVFEIVSDYRNRSYDQTLDMIEEYCLDLDLSIDRFRTEMAEREGDSPPRFGDNPLRGFRG